MGKRKGGWSQERYFKLLAEGRGKGDLDQYKPWITTYDFPSKGKTIRIQGRITHRIHHLMSNNEKWCLLLLEFTEGVTDIKEQYPLPLEDTQIQAKLLGIRHPFVNGFPYVMTIDFMYCRYGQWHALQVKPADELEKTRVREKFRIEKEALKAYGIDWKCLSDKEIDVCMARNIEWLYSGEPLENLIHDPFVRTAFLDALLTLYQDRTIPFEQIVRELDSTICNRPGTTLQAFKHLVLNHQIQLNLSRPIHTADPRIIPCLRA